MTVHDRFHALDAVQAISDSPRIKALTAAFECVWDARVVRTRNVIPIEDELKG